LKAHKFKAELKIIGINPYVSVPEEILEQIFQAFGKDKGTLPICGKVNNRHYTQTLVKYQGEWRLYINTAILKNSPKRIGEMLDVTIAFDPNERSIAMHPRLEAALKKSGTAQKVFEQLPPSRQKEIIRYISFLKTETSVSKNVQRAIDFLLGKERFIGRDKPL
jgi:hypothetical protein